MARTTAIKKEAPKKKLTGAALAYSEFNMRVTAELKEQYPNQSGKTRRKAMLRLWKKSPENPNRVLD